MLTVRRSSDINCRSNLNSWILRRKKVRLIWSRSSIVAQSHSEDVEFSSRMPQGNTNTRIKKTERWRSVIYCRRQHFSSLSKSKSLKIQVGYCLRVQRFYIGTFFPQYCYQCLKGSCTCNKSSIFINIFLDQDWTIYILEESAKWPQ